jgi:D-alanine-D-alanine ligase
VKIVVLHDELPDDPRPDEQDSLAQAQAVARRLGESGHETWLMPCGLDLAAARRALAERAPELVFNLVESVGGTGRLIHLPPALLGAMGLPHTGASAEAMWLTSHKVLAKRLLAGAGLPTPAWVEAGGGAAHASAGRWIVKSVHEDASIGMDDDALVEVADPRRLPRLAAERSARLGGEAFAEAYVEGREFNLALLGSGGEPEVLPAAEIAFDAYPPGKPRIVGYAAKWHVDSFEYRNTPHRFEFASGDAALLAELDGLARRCWSLFGLAGYARVDFRVDADGRPWILEVNANPCLSDDAGFLCAASRAELGPHAVIERIVAEALSRA